MDSIIDYRLPDSYAICLLGHGSREQEGIQEFLILLKKLRKTKFCSITEYGFLGYSRPTIPEALSACQQDGIKNIIIMPSILLPGEHTKKDIPNAIGKVFQNRPDINIFYAEPLGTQAEIMKVCKDRIWEAENSSQKTISHSETLFITVAHGSHDINSNSQVEKNFHLLGQKLSFGKTIVHFAGLSQKPLEEKLEEFLEPQFRRIILFPFFLFTGTWVKRVHTLANIFQIKYPDTEFIRSACLKDHKLIVKTLIQQARTSISNK
jgi:precorrin-8X/cobalt-precorrin-8 methylmutase